MFVVVVVGVGLCRYLPQCLTGSFFSGSIIPGHWYVYVDSSATNRSYKHSSNTITGTDCFVSNNAGRYILEPAERAAVHVPLSQYLLLLYHITWHVPTVLQYMQSYLCNPFPSLPRQGMLRGMPYLAYSERGRSFWRV